MGNVKGLWENGIFHEAVSTKYFTSARSAQLHFLKLKRFIKETDMTKIRKYLASNGKWAVTLYLEE